MGIKLKKEQKQKEYGENPLRFLYEIVGIHIAVGLAKRLWRIHAKPDKRLASLPGPIISIGNHPSYIDPFSMAALFGMRRVNFVAGTFLFRKKFIGNLFRLVGVIPKIQFRTDSRALRSMLRVLQRGGVLGIFPEATRSVDGTESPFDDALARLIKKTNSTIVLMRTHGAYSTWPRWTTSGRRPGYVESYIHQIILAEQVSEMTPEQIHQLLRTTLAYNEYDWLREHPHTYRSKKITAGTENIAYMCPACMTENQMKSEKNALFCGHCGNRAQMDASGFYHPAGEKDRVFPDLHQWVMWEKEQKMQQFLQQKNEKEMEAWLLRLDEEENFRLVGKGTLQVKADTIVFKGTACTMKEGILWKSKWKKKIHTLTDLPEEIRANQKDVHDVFSIPKIRGMVASYGKHFELIEAGGQTNRFLLLNGQAVLSVQHGVQVRKDALAE